jgi:hypothetical protein
MPRPISLHRGPGLPSRQPISPFSSAEWALQVGPTIRTKIVWAWSPPGGPDYRFLTSVTRASSCKQLQRPPRMAHPPLACRPASLIYLAHHPSAIGSERVYWPNVGSAIAQWVCGRELMPKSLLGLASGLVLARVGLGVLVKHRRQPSS